MITYKSSVALLLIVSSISILKVKCWSDLNDVLQEFQSESGYKDDFFSCKGLSESLGENMMSGTYTVHLPSGYHEVFCETGINRGVYTFLSARSLTLLGEKDMKYLVTDTTNILLRISKSDGTQPYTVLQPLNNMDDKLLVQLNTHVGTNSPLNWHMGTYLYVSTVGRSKRTFGQGFSSNGKRLSHRYCDDNASSYFAFFPNPREQQVILRPSTQQRNRGLGSSVDDVCTRWRSSSVRPASGRRMPLKFFMFTEMRFGGSCGCYSTSDRWMQSKWKGHGTAIGVR